MDFTWEDILCEEPIDERRKVADMCCDIEVFRQCRSLILIPHSEVRVLTGASHEHSFVQNPQAITNNSSIGSRVEMSLRGRSSTSTTPTPMRCSAASGWMPSAQSLSERPRTWITPPSRTSYRKEA